MSPARPPYAPLRPFTWPEPGVQTWFAPVHSYFAPCTGQVDCEVQRGCPVGVVRTLDGGPYGCDCPCHRDGTK